MLIIVQNKILHYRKPLYNLLASKYEVLVVHSGKESIESTDCYKEIILPSLKVGPFYFQIGLWKLLLGLDARKVDGVIAMCDLRWIFSILFMFRFDTVYPWIWWGVDQGASKLSYRLKTLILRRSNPILVYNERIKDDLERRGVSRDKIFVANNTFHVDSSLRRLGNRHKDIFINVGSLDSRKRNDVTIRTFVRLMRKLGRFDLKLILIGDGAERPFLQSIIDSMAAADLVVLVPTINDPFHLAQYYSRSIASVSFGQAGLAVLQSMAFGVPFVTSTNAISGGEKNNIVDGYNGFLCQPTPESLSNVLRLLIEDKQLASRCSMNAFEYYSEHCTIEGMAKGFNDSIRFARQLK